MDQRSAIGPIVEWQTRLVRLLHLSARDSDQLHDALAVSILDLPAGLLRSITWNYDTEMARLLDIANTPRPRMYFCWRCPLRADS